MEEIARNGDEQAFLSHSRDDGVQDKMMPTDCPGSKRKTERSRQLMEVRRSLPFNLDQGFKAGCSTIMLFSRAKFDVQAGQWGCHQHQIYHISTLLLPI
jgi:hypothetical protein